MYRFAWLLCCALGLLVAAGAVAADTPARVITLAGDVYPMPQAAYQPSPTGIYKVVFSLTKSYSDKPGEVNPALEHVARAVNLYVTAGVPLSHLKFVAIAYGAATPLALDDTHYRAQFGVANPNLPVIAQLRKAGVEVAVCGQSALDHLYKTDWIAKDITVALSALTAIPILEQQGYALIAL